MREDEDVQHNMTVVAAMGTHADDTETTDMRISLETTLDMQSTAVDMQRNFWRQQLKCGDNLERNAGAERMNKMQVRGGTPGSS